MTNCAFVYHYWNINNLMSYYGYKENWNQKKYSAFDIFVEHPLGEKSTNTHYCSSCEQKRWKEACENGEIYGEIISVFTGENAGKLAHEMEHQMIITHKAIYGQETLYNRNDAYGKFSTAGQKPSKETIEKRVLKTRGRKRTEEQIENIRRGQYGNKKTEETKRKIGIKNTGKYWNEERKNKWSNNQKGENNTFYGKHHNEKTIEDIRIKQLGKKQSKETIEKRVLKTRGKKRTEETIEKMKDAQKDRMWINNGEKRTFIKKQDFNYWNDNGWIAGYKIKKRA